KDNTVLTIVTRQSIYTGGRISSQISRAEAMYDVSVARLGVTEAQVALQTREAYYGVLLAQSLVKSAGQSLTSARDQLKTATDRFEVGTAARFDVLRAQTQVSEAEQTLTEARNQVQISQVALDRVLGLPLDKPLALAEPAAAPQLSEDVAALIQTADKQRGELLAARAQVAAAESGIRLARSQRLPQLGLSANYQNLAIETPAQTNGWTLMVTASMEIFDGGRARSDIAEAKALKNEASANLQDASRGVEQDVRQAYLNLQTARQTIDTAKARLAQAQEAYDVATVRYQAGVGTATEVADALSALTAARTNLDRATFNYSTAYARLQRALGNIEY
ncbi:MAG TPA: TolC family protein, partial [Armatimonadota bacterium]|nr:TolC family protein [Armatimonadota bacterium]